MSVWVLQVRKSGEEDDVYLFTEEEFAENALFEYFSDEKIDEEWKADVDAFGSYLYANEIGYYDIREQKVMEW